MRLVVKGVSAIREGDEVLGGPLDYYSARQLTEGAPTPAPEAEPAVPPATTSIIDGVTRGLVLVMTMDPEIDGLIKGPLGTAGKVHGKPTWLRRLAVGGSSLTDAMIGLCWNRTAPWIYAPA